MVNATMSQRSADVFKNKKKTTTTTKTLNSLEENLSYERSHSEEHSLPYQYKTLCLWNNIILPGLDTKQMLRFSSVESQICNINLSFKVV